MALHKLNVKARLAQLGKRQTELRDALKDRGYNVDAPRLSRLIRGESIPRDSHILSEIDLIVLKWERQNNGG